MVNNIDITNPFSIKETSEIVSFIILIITLSGLTLGGLRKILSFIKKYFKMFNEAVEQLAYVYKEVKPNSGSSLYDKITRLSGDLKSARTDIFIQSHITKQIRDDMHDMLYCEFDERGDFVFANKHLEELTGISSSGMTSRGWLTFISESERALMFSKWEESLRTKIPFQATFNLIDTNEKEELYIIEVEQIKDQIGEIIYFVGRIRKK